jgi:uncharacterized protein (TIGR03437 family)
MPRRFRTLYPWLILACSCGPVTAQTLNFSTGSLLATQPGPLASITGDFNQDGHTDLAIANTAVQSISILLGVGDGTFQAAVPYSTAGCQPGQVITGDFNRDGHLDLLASCTLTDTIAVLPGKGDGTFGTAIFSKTPFPVVSGFLDGFVEPLTAADINGDGILDLALIIQTSASVGLDSPGAIGQAVVMTGRGDGTFAPVTPLNIAPAGTEPYAVQLADVNGDGKVDIAGIAFEVGASGLAQPLTAFFFVAMGNGSGSFQLEHSYPLTNIPQTGMMLADLNGDGKLDVVFAGLSIAAVLNTDVNNLSGVGVFLGNGDGSFTPGYAEVDSQTTENQAIVGSALASVFGGKSPDIVSLLFLQSLTGDNAVSGSIVVRPNNGDGTFGAPQTLVAPSTTSFPFSLSVGDFNSDGRPDLVAISFSVNLLNLILGNSDILSQIDTIGQSIAQFPAGTARVLLNGTLAATFTDTNAASFQTGGLATSSIVTAFGAGLSSSTKSADGLPLPTALAGASITVTDSLGVARPAPLFYVSPTQINYAIPDGTAINTATVAITTPSGVVKVQQPIVATAPGLFNASGLALGQILTYNGGTTPVVTSTVLVNAEGQLSANPIDVGTGTTAAYLVLYGTGIRNHQTLVTATIGTTVVTAAFAGAQGAYLGEDQINILLPQSLRGAGAVTLTLNADGHTTNPVSISLQ